MSSMFDENLLSQSNLYCDKWRKSQVSWAGKRTKGDHLQSSSITVFQITLFSEHNSEKNKGVLQPKSNYGFPQKVPHLSIPFLRPTPQRSARQKCRSLSIFMAVHSKGTLKRTTHSSCLGPLSTIGHVHKWALLPRKNHWRYLPTCFPFGSITASIQLTGCWESLVSFPTCS